MKEAKCSSESNQLSNAAIFSESECPLLSNELPDRATRLENTVLGTLHIGLHSANYGVDLPLEECNDAGKKPGVPG